MTTAVNGATPVEMTVSVKVLVVDGTRRMSHKFYDQIPGRDVIDENGEIVDGAEPWGQVNLGREVPFREVGVEVVWTLDGRPYVAWHTTKSRVRRDGHPRASAQWREEWNATVDQRNFVIDGFNATVRRLASELPQLFVGG